MYNDLDADNWPDDIHPTQHRILRALLQDGFSEPPSAIGDGEYIDEYVKPKNINHVLDADSSQIQAIVDVNNGRNLVVQGPPGTGKSQTIANIIAEALYQKKTVLFVAEKMAALEVVKRRLDAVGLGDACLELHSQKTQKKVVLNELERTLNLGQPRIHDNDVNENLLLENRARLNRYATAVNTVVGESGYTPFQSYGYLLLLRKKLGNVTFPTDDGKFMKNWTGSDFHKRRELVEEMESLLNRIGSPKRHPCWGSQLSSYLPSEKSSIKKIIGQAGKSIHELQQSTLALANHLQISSPTDLSATKQLVELTEKLLVAPNLVGVRVSASEWVSEKSILEDAISACERLTSIHKVIDKYLVTEAWEQDVTQIRDVIKNYSSKWWRILSGEYRQVQNQFKLLCQSQPPKKLSSQIKILEAILESQQLKQVLNQHDKLMRRLYGDHWQGAASDTEYLRQVLLWVVELLKRVQTGDVPPQVVATFEKGLDRDSLQEDLTKLKQAVRNRNQHITIFKQRLHLDGGPLNVSTLFSLRPFADQIRYLKQWYVNVDKLTDIVAFNQQAQKWRENGLNDFLPVATSWQRSPGHLTHLFDWLWYNSIVHKAMGERPILQQFDQDIHENRIERFRELDQKILHYNKVFLAYQHWKQLPQYEAGGQLGILKREFAKKRRHKPIRQLMLEAGNAIQGIKPVFMMSPMSIAMFLPPGSMNFDLVVFDEASQVKPVDAFGAILRGKQTVVVGDRHQLPPTSFFEQLTEIDEEVESATADLESVLTLFSAQGAPDCMLRWHYRSRHESLIALSNQEFYDNRLLIFPSPALDKKTLGLVFHHVPNGIYERGTSRMNRREAEAVATAIMHHAQTCPENSLGVAAFNTSQMEAIQLHLEKLRQQDPSCEHFFAAHPEEPFFVKNLENVQGDERDVIFISVGYGRDENGRLSMNFGPLNQDGGERRLNVLVTRAKRRCEVFSSIVADDIDLNRTKARGVQAFKQYLNYAQHGLLQTPISSGRAPDSPFEEAVTNALRQKGYSVVNQVGSAGFFVDLAIVDKQHPGRYLMGIECDGATYHSSRSARDRDRLRQQVLEDLGWRIYRIWSTDWFRNSERELKRLIEAIENVKTSGKSETRSATLSPQSVENGFDPIERHEADFHTNSSPVSVNPYKFAKLNIGSYPYNSLELHEVPQQKMVEWIKVVVKVESPVHVEEVIRRISNDFGVSRIGNRIRHALENAIADANRQGNIHKKGDFLWEPGIAKLKKARTRDGLPNVSRKIELIAPEEIELVIKSVVESTYGIKQEEIASSVCKVFGFGRASAGMKEHVDQIIEKMLSQTKLVRQRDFVVISE